MPKQTPQITLCLAAIALAALIGYVDQHNDEVWAALILMLPSTFTFGFLLPQRAWLGALIIGGGVFSASVIGVLIGYTPPCHPGLICPPPSLANSLPTLIALIPAFIGAYTGAIFSWMTSFVRKAGSSS